MEEHCIDINQIIAQKLKEALSELHSFHPDCRIHRVSEGIRRAKPEAYEPIVVSIGPYHLKNPKLQAMKHHKLRYLHLILERREENVEKYIVEMKKLEDRVRNCYVEPIYDLNSEEFVEMMLLDACFIIEFFRKIPINPILNVDCMEEQIYRDLMLLENQLPFFLLSRFYYMITKDPEDPDHDDIEDREEDSFLEMAKSNFIGFLPMPYLNFSWEFLVPENIMHLLHLVHVLCNRPLPEQTEINTIFEIDNQIDNQMHNAVELEEAGVKFKMVDWFLPDTEHLFNVTFNNGVMEVPCFSVDNTTETFFRNLIAFEQHSGDVAPKYFTEYAYFMDQLINSEKDVKLLRDKRIIENYLADDKEASNLFNKLYDGVVRNTDFYDGVFRKVNQHYNKFWNRMRAALVRTPNYCDTPFAIASTIAAVVLLVLTLLQTIAVFIYK